MDDGYTQPVLDDALALLRRGGFLVEFKDGMIHLKREIERHDPVLSPTRGHSLSAAVLPFLASFPWKQEGVEMRL